MNSNIPLSYFGLAFTPIWYTKAIVGATKTISQIVSIVLLLIAYQANKGSWLSCVDPIMSMFQQANTER